MNDSPRLLGVFRERDHSPGRESDDALILRATADRLAGDGHAVELVDPEDLDAAVRRERPALVFYMCEQEDPLERLAHLERAGVRLVNPLAGVRNTFRHRMVPILERLGDAFPASRMISTADDPGGVDGLWVKRGDYHQTQAGDVVFAADRDAARGALDALRERGVTTAVLQDHVDGDIVKFYGVGNGDDAWFHCFYHRDQELRRTPYAPEAVAALARSAAALMRLEVYGGDVIVRPDGRLAVIDVNAWPSFALVREEAASRIAAYLSRQIGVPK